MWKIDECLFCLSLKAHKMSPQNITRRKAKLKNITKYVRGSWDVYQNQIMISLPQLNQNKEYTPTFLRNIVEINYLSVQTLSVGYLLLEYPILGAKYLFRSFAGLHAVSKKIQ